MQMVGQAVEHSTFGQGTIIQCSDSIVTVSFPTGDKKFEYPDALTNFLILKNKSAQDEINAICSKLRKARSAQKQAIHEEQEHRERFRALKITPNSQAAFNLNFNDLDDVFSSGAISTGCYLGGNSKGKPRIPSKMMPNSACLLTGCAPDALEKERRILGAFMVKDDFWGGTCENGLVACHDRYQARLNPDKTMLYWDYFDRSDALPRWGNSAFKYFPNITMQRILLDMKEAAHSAGEATALQEFYQYFCEINRLPGMAGSGTHGS